MINVKSVKLGELDNNCYLITDESTGEAALVDCTDASQKMLDFIGNANLKYILLTHGHFDHIGGVPEIKEKELLSHIKKFGNLKGVLGTKLATIIEKQAGGDFAKQAHTAKNWRLIITGTKGYETAQITCGGIPESELDGCKSKLVPGLYICGEIANRQFPCGGFNLDYAWNSGIAAADDIAAEYSAKRK